MKHAVSFMILCLKELILRSCGLISYRCSGVSSKPHGGIFLSGQTFTDKMCLCGEVVTDEEHLMASHDLHTG